ncbi:protein TraK [Escherichia coli]|uniref:Protein TraK n=1 Tax=Escherichia coli TaxID=562 RepID=A0A2X1LCW0_ECOLX|nr:protein TraK [Escherichia coli]
MKREGFWRDVTPPLNIYGVPLPFTMIYLLLFPYPSKTTFWGVQRHFAVFCAPGVLRMDCPDALPASVQPGAG